MLIKLPRRMQSHDNPNWRALIEAVEDAHNTPTGRRPAWNSPAVAGRLPRVGHIWSDLHYGHEQCDAELFVLDAALEMYEHQITALRRELVRRAWSRLVRA